MLLQGGVRSCWAQITDTPGRNVTLAYNAQNLLERITDPANRQTTFAYTSGYLTSVTDAAGFVTAYTYDGSGNLTKICDPRGNRTLLTYDTQRRITSLKRVTSVGVCADATGTGPTTTVLYGSPNCTPDPDPSLKVKYCTVVRDPRSFNTTYHLDAELRAKRVRDALSKDRWLGYTGNSDLTTYKNHALKIWTNTWSTNGNDNLERAECHRPRAGRPAQPRPGRTTRCTSSTRALPPTPRGTSRPSPTTRTGT